MIFLVYEIVVMYLTDHNKRNIGTNITYVNIPKKYLRLISRHTFKLNDEISVKKINLKLITKAQIKLIAYMISVLAFMST